MKNIGDYIINLETLVKIGKIYYPSKITINITRLDSDTNLIWNLYDSALVKAAGKDWDELIVWLYFVELNSIYQIKSQHSSEFEKYLDEINIIDFEQNLIRHLSYSGYESMSIEYNN